MKIALHPTILSLISLTSCSGASIRASKQQQQQQQEVVEHSTSISIQECTVEEILPLIRNNPNFSHFTKSDIEEACDEHHRALQESTDATIPFSYLSGKGRQFDKNYFDGATEWNTGQDEMSKVTSAGRIAAVSDAVSGKAVEWPSYITNFDNCDMRAAMCCFTKVQDPDTGLVSSGDPTTDKNSDVCLVHLDRSPQAGHVTNGKTFYSDGRNFDAAVDDAYCTGFTWSGNPDDFSTKYRANTLFHISMYDGFYQNNRVGSVPGAPMCGCVEQMPVVSHSDCVEPVQARRLSVRDEDGSDRLLVDVSLNFVPCSEGSLVDAYAADASNDVEAFSDIVTGSCVEAVDAYLAPSAYKRGSAWWYADEDLWTPILGKKFLYHPEMSLEDFNTAFAASSTKVIRRICKSCSPSHRDIYYKRLTSIPDSLDMITLLKDSFSSAHNVLGTDFELYSKDKKGNVTNWSFCDYSGTHGFPYQCGPTEAVADQWTSSTLTSTYAKDYAFYIEK